MATTLKLRRGTTAEHSTFTGAVGEVTVDTDKDVIVVHDGSTAGGFPAIRAGGALGTPSSGTVTNLTGTASININGTVGATTPAAGTFTSLSDSGNLAFTGTGNRITGDFSNATVANRVAFQTSTVNGATQATVIPNGSGTVANFGFFNNSDPSNAAGFFVGTANAGTEARLNSTITGTGTYLPMTFYTGGSLAMTIDTSRNVGIGTTNPGNFRLAVVGSRIQLSGGTTSQEGIAIQRASGYASITGINNDNNAYNALAFFTGASEAARIDTSGNVGIGTSLPANTLDINAASATFRVRNSSGGNDFTIKNIAGPVSIAGSVANTPIAFMTNDTERARIDSSGNVAIGTTSAGANLHVAGANTRVKITNTAGTSQNLLLGADSGVVWLGNENNGPLYFITNNVERVRIDASGYTQFSSNLVMPYQGTPTSKAAVATLTGAELVTGLLNTTGTTYTITLPTGANIEAALTWSANNVSLDWTVINTASGTITIGANGNTTLGALTIATGTSAGFRIRRTAANTFTVYRMR